MSRDVKLSLKVMLHESGAVSESGVRYGPSTCVARFLRGRVLAKEKKS